MMNSVRRVSLGLLVAATASCGSDSGITTTATAHVSSVVVTATTNSIAVNGTAQLTATPKDASGNALTGLATAWSSSGNAVATVSSSGTVTGVSAGTATITATISNVQGTTSITVTAPVSTVTIAASANPSNGGTVSGAGTYNVNSTVTLNATPNGGFAFTNWTEGANVVSTSATYAFTATVSRTLVANFATSGPDPCAPITMTFPGTVNGAVSSTGCVVGTLPAAVYRFTVPSASGVTFSVTGAFPPAIDVMSDPPGSNVAIGSTGSTTASAEWLLPAGTYQFRVRAISGSGTFAITGTNTAGNTTTGSPDILTCLNTGVFRLLVVGGTYTNQSLRTGDCVETDNSLADLYVISSSKPCTITMTPTGFNAFLAVYDPTPPGTTLAALPPSSPAGVGVPLTANLAACNNGGNPIFIEANTYSPGETGGYTLQVTITGGGSIVAGDGQSDSPIPPVPISFDQLFKPFKKPPR